MKVPWSSDAMSAEFTALAGADILAFGGVGIASQTLPPTEAYHAIEHALPDQAEQLRPRLTEVIANGTPAGKAYAATLLGRFDPAAARAAWESLLDDPAEFTTFTGCVMGRTTLAQYARDQLDPS